VKEFERTLDSAQTTKTDEEAVGPMPFNFLFELAGHNMSALSEDTELLVPGMNRLGIAGTALKDGPTMGSSIKHDISSEIFKSLSTMLQGPGHFVSCPAYYSLDHSSCDPVKSYTHGQLHEDASKIAAILRSKMPTSCMTKPVVMAVSTKNTYEGYAMVRACLFD
jgi:hypothetical protein